MSGRTIIHMNGKDYDASGASLTPLRHTPRTMDGIISQPKNSPQPRHTPAAPLHRTPQKAHTLYRKAVKKPVTLSGASNSRPMPNITLRASDEHRYLKAKSIPHSPAIKKFNFDYKIVPLEPVPHPDDAPTPVETKSQADQLVDQHMKRSQAHTAPAYRKRPLTSRLKNLRSGHKKLMSIGASVSAVLLISGFIVYQSLPSISLGIASRRAGFSALLPGFTPNGYSFSGPVNYTPGKIILSFNSHTNDYSYEIEQTPTGWSSETLKEQVAASNGNQYQTFQMRDLTIFFTANNTATWVEKGVLFSLKGNSGLSGDQIATIATSM